MHIKMDDGGKGVPAPAVVADQARAAVEQFRRMQPTLSSYARALTGNPRARVVLGSATGGGGTHSTGDGTIHYTPPIQLGLPVEHDRSLCDRRNSQGLQSCPACRNRERVLASVYHEIAHFAFDSFLVLKDMHKQLMADALRGVFGGERGERMATRLLAYYGRQTSQIAPIVDKRFFPLLNGLEDSRINAAMAAARPGTRAMTQANAVEAIEDGIEYIDADGNKATAFWNQYPADLQISLACHLYASGHDIKDDWFSPPIYLALKDYELQGYLKQASTQNSVVGTFITAAMVFNRLQQVGFFEDPENPPLEQESQPEPDEQDSESEPDEQEDSNGADEDGDTSSPDEDGEEEGHAEPDDDAESEDGDGGEDESSDDGGSDAGDAGSEPDGSEADADAESDDEPGDPADDEGEGGEGDGPDQDADDTAEGGREAVDGDEAPEPDNADGAGDGDTDTSERQSDAASSAASDGGTEDAPSDSEGNPADGNASVEEGEVGESEETSADTTSDGDDVSPDEGGGQGSQPSAGDLGSGEPERSVGDSLEGDDDTDQPGDSGEHDLQAEQEGDGDHAEGEPRSDSGADEDDSQPESSEDSESGDEGDPQQSTSTGDGGPSESDGTDDGLLDDESAAPEQTDVESILDSLKAMPTPEVDPNPYEAAELMKKFMGHGEDDEPTLDEQLMIDNALDQAINQAEHFDAPSNNLSMVKIKTFDETNWWDSRPPIVIPEVHLGAPLLHLRRVFTDNSRGHKQRNLKSGRVSSRVLGRRAVVADPRLFTKKSQPGKRDYFVVIGMDISGSMVHGRRLANELAAVAAQAELLTRLGVRFEVWAHTGSGLMTEFGRAGASTTAVDMHPVKLVNEPWDAIRKGRFAGLRPTGYNLDGHTLEFYRKRLDAVTATDKILMYYTDGDMPYANFTEELAILKREIEVCRKRGYRLMGVGIETISPKAHGLDTVMVKSIRDLDKVITHLEKVLT